MANSNRQRILNYLAATTLSSSTIVAGGTYNFTVGKAARGLLSKDQLSGSDFPALFVASADEEISNDKTGKGMLVTMTVYIYGIVEKSDSNLNIQEQLDLLIEDVKKALLSDPSLGSRANGVFPKEVITDEGELQETAMFRMSVKILYSGTSTAP